MASLQQPDSHLTPLVQRIPSNIREIALILFIQTLVLYKSFTYLLTYLLPETSIHGLHFCPDNMGLSSFKFLRWSPTELYIM